MYLDPERKFAILVPRQAEAMVPEGDIDLLIRSRVGWIINVQSSPTNPSLSVAQMAARFESRYLGMDKPWTQKLSEEFQGNQLYSGLYDGSGSRAQVIIKRTQSWDFVLMFMAPGDAFVKSMDVFQRVLSSFQTIEGDQHQEMKSNEQAEATIASSTAETTQDTWQRHQENRMGVEMSYPSGWRLSRPDDFTIVFSGTPGSEAGAVIVSIRNVATNNSVPEEARAEGMLQQLRTQMAYADANIRHEPTASISIGQGTQMVQGLQMVSSFDRNGAGFQQWVIIMPRSDSNVLHVWTYVSPRNYFQKFQKTAETMASSLSLIPAAVQ